MDLHINDQHDPIRLFVDGLLKAEIVCGAVQNERSLAREVEQARALQSLARFVRKWQAQVAYVTEVHDPLHTTPAARQYAYCHGLEAGIQGVTVPYPTGVPGVPGIPPDSSLSYGLGYQHGEAMRRALALIEQEG